MGYPAIIYNSKTIALAKYAYRYQPDPQQRVIASRSISGITETLNVRADIGIDLAIRYFLNSADAAIKRNLQQWMVWAQQGKAWNFAMDASKTVLTTLSASAAAGVSALSLTSMTGVTANSLYILRTAINMEVVKVTALNSPGAGQVTIADTLNESYLVGDRFRDEQYWPARLISGEKPLIELPPRWFDLELRFQEDINDL